MSCFIAKLMTSTDWDAHSDHLRDDHLSASTAASEICGWVKVGIDVYIPRRKYQVKPLSSTWFSAACSAAIANNFFFCVCTKRIDFLSPK